ncbi:MAG: transcription antitermination factor NusB [Phycisphaerae bacterium]
MSKDANNPRRVAIRALGDRSGNVTAHLERLSDESGLSPADRGLAREIALGVVQRKTTLRSLLKAYLRSPKKRMPGLIEKVFLTSLYQMLFLQRVPDFAAVNEGVEIVRRSRYSKQAGFINGVLRAIERDLGQVQTGTPPAEPDVLAIGPDTYRRVGKPVFPDPSVDPTAFLANACSLPPTLAERWLANFGPLKKTYALGLQCNVHPPIVMRVNRLRATMDELIEKLAAEGVDARPHANGRSVVLLSQANVSQLNVMTEGLAQPQDATQTEVCLAANPHDGQRVLDFCGAPGTKTTHLAELMDNSGEIVALDVSDQKVGWIRDNCRRLGIDIVKVMLAEQAGQLEPGSFDLAVVDVPCSNTGVLARRAEARWRFDPKDLGKLVSDQKFLAQAAAEFVRPGGKLVYSSCSIEPEEGSDLVKWLNKRSRKLHLKTQRLTLPSGAGGPDGWRDGGFYAIFDVS